ncbi:MAG TPA: DUF6596 domain-containing protein [Candidatus Dormibacteraeota bacterium]
MPHSRINPTTGDAEAEVGRIFHEEFGRSVAGLIRLFGDVDIAEDAVQEAFTVALRKWPVDGFPPNPGGWIMTTARNRAIDRWRRESRERELLVGAAALAPQDDDLLSLIFTCCHPALSMEAQVALALRLLCGLSTRDVARSFLVEESTMAQRLVRAKRKIKAARIPYRVPDDDELPDRIRPVLAVIYLVYNAGLTSATDTGLRFEAIRLARTVSTLIPGEPEAAGLLALLLLVESRQASRTRADGSLVLLGEQDRKLWDRALIREGRALVRACLRRNQPGPYQLQAAIQAVHADATTIEETDWPQIVALYDQLYILAPTPVVALNRAIAHGEVRGSAVALALVDELKLDNYHLFHATRADLLRRLGRHGEAALAYQRAAALAPTDSEREFLRAGGRGSATRTQSEKGR